MQGGRGTTYGGGTTWRSVAVESSRPPCSQPSGAQRCMDLAPGALSRGKCEAFPSCSRAFRIQEPEDHQTRHHTVWGVKGQTERVPPSPGTGFQAQVLTRFCSQCCGPGRSPKPWKASSPGKDGRFLMKERDPTQRGCPGPSLHLLLPLTRSRGGSVGVPQPLPQQDARSGGAAPSAGWVVACFPAATGGRSGSPELGTAAHFARGGALCGLPPSARAEFAEMSGQRG